MRRVNYAKTVRPDTFIGRYLAHMQSQETPVAYDFWCACWLLSLALGRGVTVPRPRAPVYMNLYAILVAESGTTRKSSAVRHCTSMARKLIDSLREINEHVDLIENKSSPEALHERMVNASLEHGYAHTAIAISELVTFMGKERYTLSMPGFLTDLYDSPNIRSGGGTLLRKSSTVKDIFINLLSASTPVWLARAVNPDVVEGGFTSRCLFIVSEKRKKHIAWPEERTDEATFEEGAVDFLTHTRKRAKAIKELALRPDALEYFRGWYSRREESIDSFRSSFQSREDSHVLRLAGFLSVNDDRWEICVHDIKTAIEIIKEIREDGASIFLGGGAAPLLLGVDLLRQRLIEAGIEGVTQTQLYLSVRRHLQRDEFKIALEIMHEMQMVQRFVQPREPGASGAPGTIWRATKLLVSKGAMKDVMEVIDSRQA